MIQCAGAARGAAAVAKSLLFSPLYLAFWLPPTVAGAIQKPHGSGAGPFAAYVEPPPDNGQILTLGAADALRPGGQAILWVYFSDKGETDAASLARAVAEAGVRVPIASRARRARLMGGSFIPDYSDVPALPRYVRRVESAGGRIRHISRWLNAVSVEVDEAGARRIAELPFVRRITPVMRTEPQYGPPGDYGGSLTQNQGINAVAAHDSGYSAAGVVVAVLDTGFRKDHDALAPLKRLAEWDFVQSDGETANQAGDDPSQWEHGTGVWSILGGYLPGALIGPAFNASYVLAKTKDILASQAVSEDHWVAAAQWVDSIGVDIVSSSMVASYPIEELDGMTTPMAQATNTLTRHGILVVTAMGNSGPGTGTLWTPSDCDSILAVGSVDGSNVISNFSSRGPTQIGRGKPDLVARGEQTLWACPTYADCLGNLDGTSLATPLVSGAAALVQEAHPEWTSQQVRYALKSTADKATTADSTTYGWGRPDVVAAIYRSTLGGPLFPKPFPLVAPPSGVSNAGLPVTFRWRRAIDLNPGDVVGYALQLKKVSPSMVVFTTSTPDTFFSYSAALDPGTLYEWTVVATDLGGHARSCHEPFRFTTGGGLDQAPAATATATAEGPENTLLSFGVTAADPDGDAISSLTASPLPAGSTFTPNGANTSGMFSWTPSFTQAGLYNLTFTASNALSGVAATAITVTNVNQAPVVDAIAALTVAEGGTAARALVASDPDGDPVTLSMLSGPAFASVAGTTLTVSPTYADSGSYTVVVRAVDESLNTDQSASVVVTNVDRAPVVTAPPTQTGKAGVAHSFALTASDPDGDPIASLIVDTSLLPVGHDAIFSTDPPNNSGTFTWNSTPSDTGSFIVTFTAANALTGTAPTSIQLRMPLSVAVPTDAAGVEGLAITLTATATNPEASETLAMSAAGAPASLSFSHTTSVSPATATLTGTLTHVDAVASPHAIVWSVSDGSGETASATTILHVSTITAVTATDGSSGPPRVVYFRSRPNPFQSSAQIELRMDGGPLAGQLTIGIYDIQGRLVRSLFKGASSASTTVSWDGTTTSGERAGSGVYYYRLDVGSTHLKRRLILLK